MYCRYPRFAARARCRRRGRISRRQHLVCRRAWQTEEEWEGDGEGEGDGKGEGMGRILQLYCTDHPILLSTSQVMSPGLRLSLGWKRFSSSSPSHLLAPVLLRHFFLLFRFAASSYPSSAEYLIPGLPLSFMLYSAPHRRRTRRYDSAGGRGTVNQLREAIT